MAETNPALAALADIQEPTLAEQFYLAPGYILLGLVGIAMVVILALWLYRRYQRQAPKRAALQLLQQLDVQQAGATALVSQILKQYLLSMRPQHPALTYSGAQWQHFLQQSIDPKANINLPDLRQLQYAAAAEPEQISSYRDFALAWLKQHQREVFDV